MAESSLLVYCTSRAYNIIINNLQIYSHLPLLIRPSALHIVSLSEGNSDRLPEDEALFTSGRKSRYGSVKQTKQYICDPYQTFDLYIFARSLCQVFLL